MTSPDTAPKPPTALRAAREQVSSALERLDSLVEGGAKLPLPSSRPDAGEDGVTRAAVLDLRDAVDTFEAVRAARAILAKHGKKTTKRP